MRREDSLEDVSRSNDQRSGSHAAKPGRYSKNGANLHDDYTSGMVGIQTQHC